MLSKIIEQYCAVHNIDAYSLEPFYFELISMTNYKKNINLGARQVLFIDEFYYFKNDDIIISNGTSSIITVNSNEGFYNLTSIMQKFLRDENNPMNYYKGSFYKAFTGNVQFSRYPSVASSKGFVKYFILTNLTKNYNKNLIQDVRP